MTEVTEDEFIDDPMAAIDKLSDLLESQSDTELAELSEELEKKHDLDLGVKRFVPSMIIFACIPVPFMMNVYSLAIRTDMFNKISDKLQESK